MTDAVVIGAGPNGLVAANVLVDHGWDVVVVEANEEPGGAVRTAEITAPGFRSDLFSAFYPLAAVSPVLRDLDLAAHGLRWTRAPTVLAHPRPDAPAVRLCPTVDGTADGLERDAPGDGVAYRELFERYEKIADPLIDSLLRPFPPVRAATRLALAARPSGLRELARLAVVPLRRFVHESFRGESARLLFAGNALHADLTPESAGSAVFGWLLVCLGQQVGFPVPVGGAEAITRALVRRLESRGGRIVLGTTVARVYVHAGRARGVITADGTAIAARRAVLADCDAAHLFLDMVGEQHLTSDFVRQVMRIERSAGTVKVDWALSSGVPWTDPVVHGAGTVHIADSLDELTITGTQLAMGTLPDKPFLLVGQMTTCDTSRSPSGTESLWAYTHVPQFVERDASNDGLRGVWNADERDRFADRMEARIERLAPGFRDRIVARHVMAPPDMYRMNANLVGGDISGGTAQLHQQLVFRPVSGWARAETPVRGLYLASASAHPGGGVHGACGNNAARAALAHHRLGSPGLRRG